MMCYLSWQESKVCGKPGFLPQKCERLQLLLGCVAVSEGSVSNCSGAEDGGEGTALFFGITAVLECRCSQKWL